MTDQPTPQTEALQQALREHRDRNEPPCESCITIAAQAHTEALDVDALYHSMVALDGDQPGIFNLVAISEPDTRTVAETLAAYATEYARLSQPDTEPKP